MFVAVHSAGRVSIGACLVLATCCCVLAVGSCAALSMVRTAWRLNRKGALVAKRRRRQSASRSSDIPPEWRRSRCSRVGRSRGHHKSKPSARVTLPYPYKPSASWWSLHALLTQHLKRRGFECASLIALRILSEGIDGAVSTVLIAFYLAVDDARQQWKANGGTGAQGISPPTCVAR
jgi:hypothetical protein